MIEVQGYAKQYDTHLAVADLSFTVSPGQILGLLGPNGAGKTTTMKAICGIIPPTAGRLLVGGFDVALQQVEAKRLLAYVPDDPHLFESLTVWEHLQFTASAYNVALWKPKAEALLSQLELTDKRDALTSELSRGMRQKVAIACAYVHDPSALLLDEPLTGLDPRGIRTMKSSLKERAAAGAAVIISSHLLALVEDLCTHLLILHKGRKLFAGPVAEARSHFSQTSDASLEEVFFSATEGLGLPSVAPAGAAPPALTPLPPDVLPPM
jgi:ABC-2 type transport system ATP-binding protein